jgi:hypothetical protein
MDRRIMVQIWPYLGEPLAMLILVLLGISVRVCNVTVD